MGNSDAKTDSYLTEISPSSFTRQYQIGRGGFGVVWNAKMKKNGKLFALKEMNKIQIVYKNSVKSVLGERMLLSILKHPFLVNMKYAFQDRFNLYLVMDLMIGGDLRYHIDKTGQFTEVQTRFFISCIIAGLEYLHVNGIVHRDIKPENLVFDNKGYLRITDFGVASFLKKDNSSESSGTPGYMSPEVINRMTHSIETDYFAVGVIAFECMMGYRPYTGRNRRDIRDQIAARQAQLRKSDVPQGWSLEAADFINKLLRRDPRERLGANGPQEVKTHSWLATVQWKKLIEKSLPSPYIIENENNFATAIHNLEDEIFDDSIDIEYIQKYFTGYYFNSSSNCVGNEATLPLTKNISQS